MPAFQRLTPGDVCPESAPWAASFTEVSFTHRASLSPVPSVFFQSYVALPYCLRDTHTAQLRQAVDALMSTDWNPHYI